MEFNVKGITFKLEELSTIKLSDIQTETISRSHIFHLLPGNRKAILLLRAGDFVEPSFITKYLDKGVESFHQLEIISDEELLFFKQGWNQFKNATTQYDKRIARDNFIKQIANDYWFEKDKSILSFVISCFEEFYVYPPHVLDKYQEVSMVLYTRSLLISAVSCISALCNDLLDYDFIKDFYNTSFLMDYGMVEFDSFDFIMARACEEERNVPGGGRKYLLAKGRPEVEIQAFIHHPSTSYRAAMEYANDFTYPELIDFIEMHHEKADGSGFPKGLRYSAMSDTETLLSFCDYLIPFTEHIFLRGDGNKVLNEYFVQLKELKNIELLPINKVIMRWESIMNWVRKDIEVAS